MRLRTKLVLIALTTLIVPWSAWRYLGEMETFLRQGEERALKADANAIARDVEFELAAGNKDFLPPAPEDALYVYPAAIPIALDGYDDEWTDWLNDVRAPVVWHPIGGGGGPRVQARLAESGEALYALFVVVDHAVDYDVPSSRGGVKSGDQLLLTLVAPAGVLHFQISSQAPGWVQADSLEDVRTRVAVRGQLQEIPNGYSVELRIPHALAVQRLGFAVVDVDRSQAGNVAGITGTGTAEDPAAPVALVRTSAVAIARLAALAPPSGRVWLIDRAGFVIAHAGTLYAPVPQSTGAFTRWFRSFVYRYFIRAPLSAARDRPEQSAQLAGSEIDAALSGHVATRWQPALEEVTVIGSAAVPVTLGGQVAGAVVIERTSEALLLLTNQAMANLFGRAMLAFLAALVLLFVFATVLSERIRRLSYSAQAAVTPDGGIGKAFPVSGARDELGDLSRSFARALGYLRDYTQYLRTLADKLSHELRTPLAIVQSSLENLEHEPLGERGRAYAERAKSGTDRLAGILRAMSEANRVEQSLRSQQAEEFDLRKLVEAGVQGYRQLAGDRQTRFEAEPGEYRFRGVPELIEQMLDKLFDNALGFTPPGGLIRMQLAPGRHGYRIAIANQGPPLPAEMQGRLFDSMVSLRSSRRGDEPHIGLGLYIVRLVAELHGGSVSARDLPDGGGVEISVELVGA